jgi:hypothetical protein
MTILGPAQAKCECVICVITNVMPSDVKGGPNSTLGRTCTCATGRFYTEERGCQGKLFYMLFCMLLVVLSGCL